MPIVKVDRGNYDAIYRKVFEQFLLGLARGWAAEEERLYLERTGEVENPLIKEINLTGEYPKTGFQITTYDRVRDLEQSQWYGIWSSPEFFDKDRKPLCSPEQMVGDTLMWVRGG